MQANIKQFAKTHPAAFKAYQDSMARMQRMANEFGRKAEEYSEEADESGIEAGELHQQELEKVHRLQAMMPLEHHIILASGGTPDAEKEDPLVKALKHPETK